MRFSVSRNQAFLLVEISCALVSRLPNTLAALECGDIDLFKASKVTRLTREVSDEVAAQVDAWMAGRLANRDPEAIRRSVRPCHDNRVSRGWTKIGSSNATQKGSTCD